MDIVRSRLYSIVLTGSVAGYLWIGLHLFKPLHVNAFEVCFFKKTTHLPCPSCGATRSVLHLVNGELLAALQSNPVGVILALILFVFPIWIVIDHLYSSTTFYRFYLWAEVQIRKPMIAALGIILVVANWIWNYKKGY